jgi:hypothetical protein
MKRSSQVKIGAILVVGVAVVALGGLADGWMRANGGDSISGNINMLVLVATVALIGGVMATDRNRAVASADSATSSKALTLGPKAGLAQVIVFRDDKMGAQIGANVLVDDRLSVQLTSPRFTCVDLAPGPHRITADFQGHQAEHEFNASEGEVLALHLKMRLGLSATNPLFETVALQQARKAIGSAPMTLAISASA